MNNLPLWLVGASLALNALFLRRLLSKLDTLYDAVVGTPTTPGVLTAIRRLRDRVDAIELDMQKPAETARAGSVPG